MLEQTRSLLEVAASIVRVSGFSARAQVGLLDDLDRYHTLFRKEHWRNSGRLARLGLPSSVVGVLRKIKGLFLTPGEMPR